MQSPDALRQRVEAYLTDLALAADLGGLREAVSYSLLGVASGSGRCSLPLLAKLWA